MNHLAAFLLFLSAGFLTAADLNAEKVAQTDWVLVYKIDRPSYKSPPAPPPPWGILGLTARSSSAYWTLSPDSMYFFIPGMDDGDNPLPLPPAETKKLLAAACQLLQTANAAPGKLLTANSPSRPDESFSLKVELETGDQRFEYSASDLSIQASLPPALWNFLKTMRPYSPEWVRNLK